MFEQRAIAYGLLVSLCLLCMGGCATKPSRSTRIEPADGTQEADLELARLHEQMVRVQLQGRDITDALVLEAMRTVPRHFFVSPDLRANAYRDGALPIKHGQTISQPYIVAFMTQLLELKGSERVLEIGTGSGYQCAVLAEIASEVYTVEIVPELASEARTVLRRLGYTNIRYRTGDGYEGWPEYAPFDRIIVTAAPADIPRPLIDQLKEGGLMVCPVGSLYQDLIVLEKEGSGITRRSTIPVRFVPMTGKAQQQ